VGATNVHAEAGMTDSALGSTEATETRSDR
jgi:hypothetical protein